MVKKAVECRLINSVFSQKVEFDRPGERSPE